MSALRNTMQRLNYSQKVAGVWEMSVLGIGRKIFMIMIYCILLPRVEGASTDKYLILMKILFIGDRNVSAGPARFSLA